MKKDEAIKHICGKGFTKRVAGKIYQAAVANVEVDVALIDRETESYIKGKFNNTDTDNENKED